MSTFLNIVESFRSYTILFRKKYYKKCTIYFLEKSITKTYFLEKVLQKHTFQMK